MSENRRTTAHHGETFVSGQKVWFRGSNEGPYIVAATLDIPDGPDDYGEYPRDGVGHHQHVTIFEPGRGNAVYSGAWLTAQESVNA